jgi:ABC-2 type transport system ATP-binding protein
VGTDVIVARVESLTDTTLQTLRSVPGVDEVVGAHHEVTVHAANGAAVMSPVALALHDAGTTVVSLTLRTPTLDDVFLQLTGSHLQDGAPPDRAERSSEHPDHPDQPVGEDARTPERGSDNATEGVRT